MHQQQQQQQQQQAAVPNGASATASPAHFGNASSAGSPDVWSQVKAGVKEYWTLDENAGKNWDEYVKVNPALVSLRIHHNDVLGLKFKVVFFKVKIERLNTTISFYSIHRIALVGTQFDKDIGQWFGPTTISQVLRVLHESQQSDTKLSIYVASDGVVVLDELKAACSRKIRLGLESLNSVYHEALKVCGLKVFGMSFCVGVAGGRPNSSLYFLGVEGENHLIYMDPHFLRQSVEIKDPSSYIPEDLESYHCPTVRIVPISTVDPSMVLGFYCRNMQETDQFVAEARQTLCEGSTPLFSIQDSAPSYGDADVLSDED
ncbi:Cysteine protease atg4b [Entophlyctis luteolus]|nr:Cysteine protease atg4b [Entophlyctis luteolus]